MLKLTVRTSNPQARSCQLHYSTAGAFTMRQDGWIVPIDRQTVLQEFGAKAAALAITHPDQWVYIGVMRDSIAAAFVDGLALAYAARRTH